MNRINRLIGGAVLALATLTTSADDVSKADRILCSTLQIDVCVAGEACSAMLPADINVPQFIVIDARAGKLMTTAASGENRETVARTNERADGQLLLQGMEAGRAFSLVIHEASGEASFASAADGRGLVAFAACTPLD